MADFVDWAIHFEQEELKMQKGGNYLLEKAIGDCNYESDDSDSLSEQGEEEEEEETSKGTKKKKKIQTKFSTIIYAHAGIL